MKAYAALIVGVVVKLRVLRFDGEIVGVGVGGGNVLLGVAPVDMDPLPVFVGVMVELMVLVGESVTKAVTEEVSVLEGVVVIVFDPVIVVDDVPVDVPVFVPEGVSENVDVPVPVIVPVPVPVFDAVPVPVPVTVCVIV